MGKTGRIQHRYGLIGRNISYSFSRKYFNEKFEKLGLDDHSYENFDLASINELPGILKNATSLKGLNVTIPYKEEIIAHLDKLDAKAEEIGAVNTIQFTKEGLIGHNTDIYGFEKAIEPLMTEKDNKALILGTGGASKAAAYVLGKLGLDYRFVSRNPREGELEYKDLDEEVMENHTIIINSTPLGTYPDVDKKPEIPYHLINRDHLLFDLIYNPELTSFMKEGKSRGARVMNGQKMLELQAEKAWEIWNS